MASTELAGRQHRKEPTRIIYLLRLISATLTDAPVVGSDLASQEFSETLTGTCVNVQIDEVRYPGRFLFVAAFEVPLTKAEFPL